MDQGADPDGWVPRSTAAASTWVSFDRAEDDDRRGWIPLQEQVCCEMLQAVGVSQSEEDQAWGLGPE